MKTATENPLDRCPVMSSLQSKQPAAESVELENSAHPSGVVAVSSPAPMVGPGRIKRFALMVLGVGFVFLAAVGVVLPGLPATGPLILASICLTKSCPWLEQRLVRSRFFAPFHSYLDGNAEMPLKAKLVAMGMMWTCIVVSSVLLLRSQETLGWVVALMILSGIVGTFVISRIGKRHTISK